MLLTQTDSPAVVYHNVKTGLILFTYFGEYGQ